MRSFVITTAFGGCTTHLYDGALSLSITRACVANVSSIYIPMRFIDVAGVLWVIAVVMGGSMPAELKHKYIIANIVVIVRAHVNVKHQMGKLIWMSMQFLPFWMSIIVKRAARARMHCNEHSFSCHFAKLIQCKLIR